MNPRQIRALVSSRCKPAESALSSVGVEHVMRGKQAKRSARPTTSAQLDLFSRPSAPPARRQVVQPDERRPAADPLVELVLGSGRNRGRPEKTPSVVALGPTDQRRLLDVREAALRLGLSKSTLDKMRCSGRGPRFIRASDRAIRYDPIDLQAFADERRRRSTADLAGLIAE